MKQLPYSYVIIFCLSQEGFLLITLRIKTSKFYGKLDKCKVLFFKVSRKTYVPQKLPCML